MHWLKLPLFLAISVDTAVGEAPAGHATCSLSTQLNGVEGTQLLIPLLQMAAQPPQMTPTPPQMVATPPQMVATPPQMVATAPQMTATPPPMYHMGPGQPMMAPAEGLGPAMSVATPPVPHPSRLPQAVHSEPLPQSALL